MGRYFITPQIYYNSGGEKMKTKEQSLLTKEDFHTRNDLPEWLYKEYQTFHQTVTDKTFPCFFGMRGELKGELRYAYVTQDDWSNLPSALINFKNPMPNAPEAISRTRCQTPWIICICRAIGYRRTTG